MRYVQFSEIDVIEKLTNGHSICEINNEGKMVDCRFIGEDIV
jgi:hypothetical protein